MKIRKVAYFIALCEEQSFTRAAKRCGIAQPSLTRAIQLLEEEVGGRLFERGGSSVRLTELGTLLLPHFVTISQTAENIERSAANFTAPDAAASERSPVEAYVRALTVAVVAISILATGMALQLTPRATALEPGEAAAQIDPYALQSAVDRQSLPVQKIQNPF